jgi:hypothetical protein
MTEADFQELVEEIRHIFGSNIAHEEHEPRRFHYQCLIAAYSVKRRKQNFQIRQ